MDIGLRVGCKVAAGGMGLGTGGESACEEEDGGVADGEKTGAEEEEGLCMGG